MKGITVKGTRIVLILLPLILCGIQAKSQPVFAINDSLKMKEFEERVLKPKNEVWVVDFWASWCRPCLETIPELKKVYEKFNGKPVRFISISWDEDARAWKAMVERTGMKWNQILLPNIRNAPFVDKHFKHKSIPTLFIVTKEGKVRKAGEIEFLENALNKELARK